MTTCRGSTRTQGCDFRDVDATAAVLPYELREGEPTKCWSVLARVRFGLTRTVIGSGFRDTTDRVAIAQCSPGQSCWLGALSRVERFDSWLASNTDQVDSDRTTRPIERRGRSRMTPDMQVAP